MLNGIIIQCSSAEFMHMLLYNFILGLNVFFVFVFLYLGMVMCVNEFETKESKISTRDKIATTYTYIFSVILISYEKEFVFVLAFT